MIDATWDEGNWKGRFFTIWGGQAVSLLGSRLVQFSLIWWLTKETGSATVLATASLVGLLPHVVLGPFAGTLVDRWSRRRVMLLADSFIALATLVLVMLFSAGEVGVGVIYVLLFLRALGGGFHWPAMSASTSLMVPSSLLMRVQGINQTLNGLLGIVSAPLAAVLLEFMVVRDILLIDVVTALFAVVPLLLIRIPEPERINGSGITGVEVESFWVDFKEGFLYVVSWPGLFILMLMAMVLNFMLNPASSLLPILITSHFDGGAVELGLADALFGVGILVGGIVLSVWGGFKKRILTSLGGLVFLGVFFAMIGVIPANQFWLACAAFFGAAVMLPMVNGPIHAIVQAQVEPEKQGRVFTMMGSLASAVSPLGLAIAGPVADMFGVQTWYVAGGVVCALMGAAGFLIPVVLEIEGNRVSEEEVSSLSAEVSTA